MDGGIYKTTIPVNKDDCHCITTTIPGDKINVRNINGGSCECSGHHPINCNRLSMRGGGCYDRSTDKTVEYELSNGVAHLATNAKICSNCNSNLRKFEMSAARDRLGLWGLSGDSEISGNVSGLDRLRLKKYNKVSSLQFSYYILTYLMAGCTLNNFPHEEIFYF